MMRKRMLFVCSLALLLGLVACGGGGEQPGGPPPTAGNAPAGGGGTAPAATATLSGKIAFEGTVPANAKIQMSADPYCAKNSQSPMTEDYAVSDGGLQNVIVYISSPVNGSFPTPTDAV